MVQVAEWITQLKNLLYRIFFMKDSDKLQLLFTLFEEEEERRYNEDLNHEEMMFVAHKRANIYNASYESFKRLYSKYEHGNVTSTGECLDGMTDYGVSLELGSVIYMYTANGFHAELNQQLRYRKESTIDKDVAEFKKLLTEALLLIPSYNDGYVYRDIKSDTDELLVFFQENTGKSYIEKGFLSSHIENTRWSDNEIGLHFVIKTSNKSNGKDLRKLSFNSEEQEVLFLSDTQFHIESVDDLNRTVYLIEI